MQYSNRATNRTRHKHRLRRNLALLPGTMALLPRARTRTACRPRGDVVDSCSFEWNRQPTWYSVQFVQMLSHYRAGSSTACTALVGPGVFPQAERSTRTGCSTMQDKRPDPIVSTMPLATHRGLLAIAEASWLCQVFSQFVCHFRLAYQMVIPDVLVA
jgi:hypothetical protein